MTLKMLVLPLVERGKEEKTAATSPCQEPLVVVCGWFVYMSSTDPTGVRWTLNLIRECRKIKKIHSNLELTELTEMTDRFVLCVLLSVCL